MGCKHLCDCHDIQVIEHNQLLKVTRIPLTVLSCVNFKSAFFIVFGTLGYSKMDNVHCVQIMAPIHMITHQEGDTLASTHNCQQHKCPWATMLSQKQHSSLDVNSKLPTSWRARAFRYGHQCCSMRQEHHLDHTTTFQKLLIITLPIAVKYRYDD